LKKVSINRAERKTDAVKHVEAADRSTGRRIRALYVLSASQLWGVLLILAAVIIGILFFTK